MTAYKRQAPIPKLDKEEKQELDYGYDKVVSHLLKECTNIVINIDKNKDGNISENEYQNSLWNLQILQSAIGSHLDKKFHDRMKNERDAFEQMRVKIGNGDPFSPEESLRWGFAPNNVASRTINLSLLYKRYILVYYRSLFEIAARLRFVRGEASG